MNVTKHAQPFTYPALAGSETAIQDVLNELLKTTSKYGLYASAHEGSSVVREEFEELWEHVRLNTGYSRAAYHEAKQLASTALKYMLMIRTRNTTEFGPDE